MTDNHSFHRHAAEHPWGRTASEAQGFRGRLQGLGHTVTGALGLVMGLVPHVLHHIGFLAGSALVAGSGGRALFGALGFLASIPALVHLHRQFRSWVAPTLGCWSLPACFPCPRLSLVPPSVAPEQM